MKIIKTINGVIFFASVLVISCTSKAEKKLESVLQITGNQFIGDCNVGKIKGEATITFHGDKAVVDYSALSYSAKEVGCLENLEIKDDGPNNTYRIIGDWNRDGRVKDAVFELKVLSKKFPENIYVYIGNADWSYYALKKLSNLEMEGFNKIMSLNIKNIPNTSSTIEPIATEEISSKSEEAVSKTIHDLCNYGEFVSSTNGVAETMEFNKDENGQLIIVYITTRGKQKLGYRENLVYFLTKPNKMYEIINIRDDNTSFQLVNPDGTIQNYNAIEH